MARLPGASEDRVGWIDRWLLRTIQRRAGRLSDTWPILAHAPGILKGWVAAEFFLDRTRRVEPRLRKLAELKVAVMVGCPG